MKKHGIIYHHPLKKQVNDKNNRMIWFKIWKFSALKCLIRQEMENKVKELDKKITKTYGVPQL